jgi:hypothetical protein
MRSLVGVASFGVLVFLLFGASAQSNAQQTTHNWDNNLVTQTGNSIRWQEINNRYDCQYQNVTMISLNKPFSYLLKSIPLLVNPVYSNQEDKCIVENKNGKFTSEFIQTTYDTQIYSTHFGSSTNKMYGLHPVIAGSVWADPVPSSDLVLVFSRGLGTKDYSVSIYKDFDSGFPAIRSNIIAWDFSETSHTAIIGNNDLAFKIDEHAFSPNGKYMVIRYGGTIAKVNLINLEMTPVVYEQYIKNNQLAISNDGRYVVTLNADLRVIDTKDCALSYDSGQWDASFHKNSYDGCKTSNNIAQELKYAGKLPSSVQLRRPYFGSDNKSLFIAVGVRKASASPSATGNSAYDWQNLKITANNHTEINQGYLAFGDSFSSGEGDTEGGTWYEPGTDEQGNKDTFEGRNLCHLSRRSYPYLIAKELGFLSGTEDEPTSPDDSGLFHSVACIGAVIHNVIGGKNGLRIINGTGDDFKDTENQYINNFLNQLGRWQPGRVKQLDVLDPEILGGYSIAESKPDSITVGISGNDAGFGDTIKSCTMPDTCKQAVAGSMDASNLAIRLMKLKPKLVETYSTIKSASPESRVYVHGYPVFVDGGDNVCNLNVFLDKQERQLVVEGVKYMNSIVKSAAAEAGVVYVDIEDILEGLNLCSGASDRDITVNGVTAGNDISFKLCLFRTGCLGSESYHPNPKAHALYRKRILDQTNKLTKEMPEESDSLVPVPSLFFGGVAVSESQNINSGGNPSLVIPEPKAFLTVTNQNSTIKQSSFMPGSIVRVEIQSTPTPVNQFIVPESGEIEEVIEIPEGLEPGAHELHLFGTTNFGEAVDYYEPIMVAVDEDDFDGDGAVNTEDDCPTVANSLIDLDQDGVDDACDMAVGVQQPFINGQQPEVGFVKGEVSPETVAGNEQLNQVLGENIDGSSTVVAETNLVNTGKNALIFVAVGITLIVGAILIKEVN